MKLACFTESFQDRSVEEVCHRFKNMGLDGLDLTVRPGGHIEPADAVEKLPLAVKSAQEAGVEILMLTTAITDADRDAERLIATASEQGIDRIKLGYYRYSQFGTLAKQIGDVRTRLEGVAKLAGKYSVLPCVHIHSGSMIPSHGTMLYELLRGMSPTEIGAYVDPMHMTIEGGSDGWRQGLDLLAPWIGLCSVKNFSWERGERDRLGQQRWYIQKVPVADGVAPLPEFFAILKKLGYDGTYTLHSEYKGKGSFKDLDTDGCLAQTAEDLAYVKTLFS